MYGPAFLVRIDKVAAQSIEQPGQVHAPPLLGVLVPLVVIPTMHNVPFFSVSIPYGTDKPFRRGLVRRTLVAVKRRAV